MILCMILCCSYEMADVLSKYRILERLINLVSKNTVSIGNDSLITARAIMQEFLITEL